MARLKGRGILFGASVTVTKENLLSVTDKAFVGRLESFGCKVVIYVEYVPVSDQPGQTAPDPDDRQKLLARQDTLRASFDSMVLVAFPGDEESLGGCLAAGRGFFHINPMGGAEPCPFSPFSDTSLKTCSLKDALRSPLFYRLKSGGYMQGEHLGGCTLFGKEEEIRRLACAP
jgi:MoaA/NifB/PqqE/SkfB family radical SAM enzyme